MPTASPNPLTPLYGLPTYSATAEELRVLGLLAEHRGGLPFAALATGSADPVATYDALFRLLTRGSVVAVDLGDGAVGYRWRGRLRAVATEACALRRAA